MGKTYHLNVNEDEPCKLCGKGGAVNGGVCLECAAKRLEGSPALYIGERAIAITKAQVEALFREKLLDIDVAYTKAEGSLSVKFKTSFSIPKLGGSGVQVETEIDFVAEKVKAKSKPVVVDERQLTFDDVPREEQEQGAE